MARFFRLKIFVLRVQQQQIDGVICGYHAVANLTVITMGHEPSSICLAHNNLRSLLLRYMENVSIEMFVELAKELRLHLLQQL